MGWRTIAGGFAGDVGSEGGTVRFDEEHADGARITLEEGGVGAPWAITCGVYGLMMHTAFFYAEGDARAALPVMKERLVAIMSAYGTDGVRELMDRFVEEF